jgi:hypothetical protein
MESMEKEQKMKHNLLILKGSNVKTVGWGIIGKVKGRYICERADTLLHVHTYKH